MRRRNDRAPAKEASQCILYELLACGIKGRGRLVQQDDRRIAKKRPCDRQTLALPAREFKPPFADDGLESFRKPQDELGAVRRFGGGIDLGVGGVRSAIPQVLQDRAMQQRYVLVHNGNCPAQATLRDCSDVLLVDYHLTPLGIVQPLQ